MQPIYRFFESQLDSPARRGVDKRLKQHLSARPCTFVVNVGFVTAASIQLLVPHATMPKLTQAQAWQDNVLVQGVAMQHVYLHGFAYHEYEKLLICIGLKIESRPGPARGDGAVAHRNLTTVVLKTAKVTMVMVMMAICCQVTTGVFQPVFTGVMGALVIIEVLRD